ncbi:ComF family protein [Streptomyces jeddahensis]|uniref:ComF family protein n=1 Tax=Streptomyces jeddahensis TaxID=1716141 RepID=UPI00098F3874|nr:ComF family protein [Streptomyces jeddahensis]
MRGWWQDLTDLVLPAECGGCGRPRTALCTQCHGALCGRAPCRVRPVPEPAGLPVVHAAAPYADAVRAVLLAHKERGVLGLARPLGEALAGAVSAGVRQGHGTAGCVHGGGEEHVTRGRAACVWAGQDGAGRAEVTECGPLLLVPVPSARRAVRARGHDPARRIALAAARELRGAGIPAGVLAVLRQRRPVADQSGLNSRQRLANLTGALEVAAGGARLLRGGGPIVLVDDLMTTGASLTEAARAVRAACADGQAACVDGQAGAGRTWRTRGADPAARRGGGGRTWEASTTAAGVMLPRSAPVNAISAAVVAATPDSFE